MTEEEKQRKEDSAKARQLAREIFWAVEPVLRELSTTESQKNSNFN